MGLSDMLRRNWPGNPRSVAKSLLKYYLIETSKFPNKNKKEIYSRVLKQRYSIIALMDEEEINKIANRSDSLMELALLTIEHENPAALNDLYLNETIEYVAEYFESNAPKEYQEFARKAAAMNDRNLKDNDSGGKVNLSQIPSRYELESQLASLIDGVPLTLMAMAKDREIWIEMKKDFIISISGGSKKASKPNLMMF